MAERLEGGIGLGGPSSIMAPSGRPALVVPSPPGSPFRRLEVLAADPAGFSEADAKKRAAVAGLSVKKQAGGSSRGGSSGGGKKK